MVIETITLGYLSYFVVNMLLILVHCIANYCYINKKLSITLYSLTVSADETQLSNFSFG